MRASGLRHGVRGFSLVELMVAMFLGIVTVAALVVGYLAAERSSRNIRVLSQMTEDAQLALTIIARDVQGAGDANITGARDGKFSVGVSAGRIRGCSGQFFPLNEAPGASSCQVGSNHSIEITRQARTDTAFDSQSKSGTDSASDSPSESVRDCGTKWVAVGQQFSNRYFIDTPKTGEATELYCASSVPSSSKVPLVPNVEQLRLSYGVAAAGASGDYPVAYVPADKVAQWDDVLAVGICVLMRSNDPVITQEETHVYTDCDGKSVTSDDHHLHRRFWRTAAIRNRVAIVVNAAAVQASGK